MESVYESEDDVKTPGYADEKSSNLIFYVNFVDGYSLRQLYEFMKGALTEAPLIFTKTGIRIIAGNGDSTIVISVELYEYHLLEYVFNSDKANSGAQHIINFDLRTLCETIKSVSQAEGICMYQEYGCEEIKIKIYGGSKNGSGGYNIVKLLPCKLKSYDLNEFSQQMDDPTLKIVLAQLCNTFSQISKNRSIKNIEFDVYGKSLYIKGLDESDEELINKNFGDSIKTNSFTYNKETSTQKYYNISVSSQIAKMLSKLTHFNKKGIVAVYCECDNLLRFRIVISYWGSIVVIIRESNK